MEINPEHPVTMELREQWHKIVAILLHKLTADGKATITPEDLRKLQRERPDASVLAHSNKDCIELSLVTEEQARRLATQ